jgi:hypothetical protein
MFGLRVGWVKKGRTSDKAHPRLPLYCVRRAKASPGEDQRLSSSGVSVQVSYGYKRGKSFQRSIENVHGVRSWGPVVLAGLCKASGLQHILYLLFNRSHQESVFHHLVQQRPWNQFLPIPPVPVSVRAHRKCIICHPFSQQTLDDFVKVPLYTVNRVIGYINVLIEPATVPTTSMNHVDDAQRLRKQVSPWIC